MDLPPSRDSGKTVHFGGNIESSGAGGGGSTLRKPPPGAIRLPRSPVSPLPHRLAGSHGRRRSAAISRSPLRSSRGTTYNDVTPCKTTTPSCARTGRGRSASRCGSAACTTRAPAVVRSVYLLLGPENLGKNSSPTFRARTAGNTSRSRFSRTGSPPRRGFRTCNPSALPRQRDATPFPVNRASPAACAARWRLHVVQRGEPRQEPRIVGRAKTGVLARVPSTPAPLGCRSPGGSGRKGGSWSGGSAISARRGSRSPRGIGPERRLERSCQVLQRR